MADEAKYAVLGIVTLAGGAALGHAFGKVRKQPRIQFNPFQGDVLPITPFEGAANTAFFFLGLWLGAVGIKESLVANGYTDAQVASIITHGTAAMGIMSLWLVASQTRKQR
jgi:hypothetical protein